MIKHQALHEQLSANHIAKIYGYEIKSYCRICDQMLLETNSAQYCNCNKFQHPACKLQQLRSSKEIHFNCTECSTAFNLITEAYFAYECCHAIPDRYQMHVMLFVVVCVLCLLSLIDMIFYIMGRQTVLSQLSIMVFCLLNCAAIGLGMYLVKCLCETTKYRVTKIMPHEKSIQISAFRGITFEKTS